MKDEYSETLDLVSRIFMNWCIEASNPDFDPVIKEVREESFICKVLNRRLEAFSVPVIIPDYMSLMIDVCTGGNPGMSLLLAYLVIERAHTENATMENKYILTTDDFSNVFCFEFPITKNNPSIEKKYREMWDSQKILDAKFPISDNKIDTYEYWERAWKGGN